MPSHTNGAPSSLLVDVLRKKSVTRHVWFECLWVGIFCLLQSGTVQKIYAVHVSHLYGSERWCRDGYHVELQMPRKCICACVVDGSALVDGSVH